MEQINITNNTGLNEVFFMQLEKPVFSTTKYNKVFGIWESEFLDGDGSLIAWKNIIINYFKTEDSDVYLFFSNNENKNDPPVWNGPYKNNEILLSLFKKRYIKIRIVIIDYKSNNDDQYNISTHVQSMFLQCLQSGISSKFFTKSFDLGFTPHYFLFTSEEDVPPGAMIRYGLANIESNNIDKYHFFEKDKIIKLQETPISGNKVKILIEMLGTKGDPVIVHEFAVMFSDIYGEQKNINIQNN